MQKNWTIIRQILLRLEESPTPIARLLPEHIENFSRLEVAYTMWVLSDAGYIEADILLDRTGAGEIHAAIARRLTKSGHELLDSVRNDTLWSKIQEKASMNGWDLTFDLVIRLGQKLSDVMFDV